MISKPSIIVISGLPGVGKSTTSRGLAQRLDLAAHVEADRLHNLIVSGAEAPNLDGVTEEAQRQLDLRLDNACLLATAFVAAGFSAVIDDIVFGARLARLQERLHGLDFEFVMLFPEFSHVKQRWIAMESPYAHKWDWIDEEIRDNTERIGLWLDTTNLDETETVDAIVNHLGLD